jgi:ribosomal protein S18 acetylase RimI-like enzyme
VIRPFDLTDDVLAKAVLELQRSAYEIEARLIGSDAIPQLHESLEVLQRTSETWLGRWQGRDLVAVLAYEATPDALDISRLAVDPAAARHGYGEELVRHVLDLVARPLTIVSTGSANAPAVALYRKVGFAAVGEEKVAPGLVVTHFELCR